MGTILPNSVDTSAEEKQEESNRPKQLDAGALFVLKSRGHKRKKKNTHMFIWLCSWILILFMAAGSWLHCGYHLTTSIVAPALLSLPLALSLMGWFPGVLCLSLLALITFYSYNLLSLVLEHHAQLGQRQLRFRDMATHILGWESEVNTIEWRFCSFTDNSSLSSNLGFSV